MFETLRNFAEVGIAVAGFSAIAVALNRDLTLAKGSQERGGLLTLLESAGFVVFFALLPQVLEQAPLAEDTLWRASLLTYAAAHLLHTAFVALRQGDRRSVVPFAPLLGFGGLLILLGQFTAGVLGDLPIVRLVYVVALGWNTLIATVSFAGLILLDSRPPTSRGSSES